MKLLALLDHLPEAAENSWLFLFLLAYIPQITYEVLWYESNRWK